MSSSHYAGPHHVNKKYDRLDPEPESVGHHNTTKLSGDGSVKLGKIPNIGPLYEILDMYRYSVDTFLNMWGIDKSVIRTFGRMTGFTFVPKWFERGWDSLTLLDKQGGALMAVIHTVTYFYYPSHLNSWMFVNLLGNVLGWTWVVLDD